MEYAHGHRADAQAVAKTLGVTQVQAIETATASLAGSATVVVLAGTDQVTTPPAGEGTPPEGTGASG